MGVYIKKWLLIAMCLTGVSAMAQTNSLGIWNDHIPHSTIYDLVKVGPRVYCASDIGMFYYDEAENSMTTFSKLHGMSDIGVRALAYDHQRGQLLMGYKNGNLDIFDGENIRNINDIFRSTKYTGRKRINHIKINGDVAYLSTGFGIVELDLNEYIILNTFIIGDDASETEVYEVDIDEAKNDIYAATEDGLLRAKTSDPLIFYPFWKKVPGLPEGTFTQVDVFNQYVFTNYTSSSIEDSLFYSDGTSWVYYPIRSDFTKKSDVRVANGYMGVSHTFATVIINPDLTERHYLNKSWLEEGTYFPNVVYPEADGITFWVGNLRHGLLESKAVTGTNKRFVPNGPFSSAGYRLTAANNQLYVSTGAIDEVWTNLYLAEGIFNYTDYEWNTIMSEDLKDVRDIVQITAHPTNPNKIFASAWGTGILEITNGKIDTIWDHISTNGALQPVINSGPDDIRTGGIAFDDAGNMWATNSLVENPLVVRRKDGTWEKFNLGNLGSGSSGFKDIAISDLDHIWMQSRNSGLIVVKIVNGQAVAQQVTNGVGVGNLPSNGVLSFAEDEDGEMWIGTDAGLVVLYSPENIFNNGDYDAQPILFEEDGVVQRLLGAESITAIAIDGANKKWFGTLNSGVFYTSQDGTETIYHFTESNSPLLANAILDIAIDHESGEVYFLTAEGIVSFRGSATSGNDDYDNVYAYPNPVRPGYEGPIFIRGLVTNAQIKITDVQGNIVSEMVAEGGQAVWYGRDLSGEKVATGVYIAHITNDDGSLVTTTKILIVN